jgi:signal transduction histidine kinase
MHRPPPPLRQAPHEQRRDLELLALAAADHHVARPEPVDVAAIAAGRREIWAPFAEEHGARVVAALQPAVALASPGSVEQVLDNLIANAVDVSPTGGTVTITVTTGREWVDIHVIDEGPGMSAERRALAFTRFWRAPDRSRRVGGSGLGLTIVRQFVEGDGGEVALRDADGGGIDAHVRLRVVPSGPGDGDLRRYRRRPEAADHRDSASDPMPS